MEINIFSQALALAFAFLLGLLLGLVYDLVRPARRRSGAWGETVLDVLFGLFCGSAVFIYAIAAPGGRLGVLELSFTLCGFLLYTYLISDRVYALTDRCFVVIIGTVRHVKNFIKKIRIVTKMYFQNMQK